MNWFSSGVEQLEQWLIGLGGSPAFIGTMLEIIAIALIPVVLLAVDRATVYLAHKLGKRVVERTSNRWDNVLYENGVFTLLLRIIPVAILLQLLENNPIESPAFTEFFITLSRLYILFLVVAALNALLISANAIYRQTRQHGSPYSIKAFTQVVQLLIFIIGGIIALSITVTGGLSVILTWLSAFAAVLMLVFRDSILGFVGGVQIALNNMLQYGDWISAPEFGADGTVIDISLTTVKVQNWDKTITSIPTYSLVSGSFQNWRGMEESGGRRIKRSLMIDMHSVHFCSDECLQQLGQFKLLHDYIAAKQSEIKLDTDEQHAQGADRRRQTNLGIFRAYVSAYLKANPDISQSMTFLVRQLQSTDKGLPLEIYVFSTRQEWAVYESIQADIFDHLLAIIPEFELRVFQSPGGADFHALLGKDGLVEACQ